MTPQDPAVAEVSSHVMNPPLPEDRRWLDKHPVAAVLVAIAILLAVAAILYAIS